MAPKKGGAGKVFKENYKEEEARVLKKGKKKKTAMFPFKSPEA